MDKPAFNRYTVSRVVRNLGDEFTTVDVATHEALRRAHGQTEDSPDWNKYLQLTGKYLKEHADDLGLVSADAGKLLRDQRWIKRSAAAAPDASTTGATAAAVDAG